MQVLSKKARDFLNRSSLSEDEFFEAAGLCHLLLAVRANECTPAEKTEAAALSQLLKAHISRSGPRQMSGQSLKDKAEQLSGMCLLSRMRLEAQLIREMNIIFSFGRERLVQDVLLECAKAIEWGFHPDKAALRDRIRALKP